MYLITLTLLAVIGLSIAVLVKQKENKEGYIDFPDGKYKTIVQHNNEVVASFTIDMNKNTFKIPSNINFGKPSVSNSIMHLNFDETVTVKYPTRQTDKFSWSYSETSKTILIPVPGHGPDPYPIDAWFMEMTKL